MASLPVPDTAKVELFFTLDNQRIENVTHWRNLTAWGSADMVALGNAMNVWWVGFMADCLSVDIVHRYAQVTDLRTVDGPSIAVVPSAPTPGTRSGGALPNNVAFCVTLGTDQRGRSGRGRNFVAGLDETEVTLSELGGPRAAAILAAYQSLLTFIPGEVPDWQLVVVSRVLGGVPRVPPAAQPVTNIYLSDLVIDSQRRRLPRRGS